MMNSEIRLKLSVYGRDYEEEEVVEVPVADSWEMMDEAERKAWCDAKAKEIVLERCSVEWEDWQIVDAKTPIKDALYELKAERRSLIERYSVRGSWFERMFYTEDQREEFEKERHRLLSMTPIQRAEERLDAAIEHLKQEHSAWVAQYEDDQRRLEAIEAEIIAKERGLDS